MERVERRALIAAVALHAGLVGRRAPVDGGYSHALSSDEFESLRSRLVVEAPKGSHLRWALNRITYENEAIAPTTTVDKFFEAWTNWRLDLIRVNSPGPYLRGVRIRANASFAGTLLVALTAGGGASTELGQLAAASLQLPAMPAN